MGKKIEALRWAMTTRPRWGNKEEQMKYEFGQMYVPWRSDSSKMIGATIVFVIVTFLLSKLILPGWFVFILWVLAAYIGIRAAWKLGNEWVDENLEITIKWKQKSEVR